MQTIAAEALADSRSLVTTLVGVSANRTPAEFFDRLDAVMAGGVTLTTDLLTTSTTILPEGNPPGNPAPGAAGPDAEIFSDSLLATTQDISIAGGLVSLSATHVVREQRLRIATAAGTVRASIGTMAMPSDQAFEHDAVRIILPDGEGMRLVEIVRLVTANAGMHESVVETGAGLVQVMQYEVNRK